jgi:HAD superfamily hydrolase (TIGR01549 family)
MTLKAVVFDWDGTLVDTAESTYRTYRKTFADYGIDFDRETYARIYAPCGDDMFRALGVPEELWREADDRWLEHFAGETVELLPGARESLTLVADYGLARGIVTSGTRVRVLRELVEHGLDPHFAHVTCGGDTPNRKPHPEPLLVCLDRLGIDPADAAYIGDSGEDVRMAKAAGVYVIGVTGPYPNHASLRAAAPDQIAENVLDAVRRLLD